MPKYLHNSTVGELIQSEFLQPLFLSQNELARRIGVPPNRISQVIRNKRLVTADTDLRLCKYFDLSPGFFLRLQVDWEIREAERRLHQRLDRIKSHVKLSGAV